jgi:PAS domain S-box-containing protein
MKLHTNTHNKAIPPSQNRSVWLFVTVAIVLVGIFFGTRIYVDYNRTISTAEERLLTQTRIIDENISTNLTVFNLMLNYVIKEQEKTPGTNQLNIYLKQLLVLSPGIRTLMINDLQGRCVYSNRDDLLGKDFSNRDYFKVPRDAPDKGMLFLSPPYTSLAGKYVINISKALTGNRGEFKGVITITLDPDYFSSLLTSTIYRPDNRVSLVHSDGTVFIAVPEAKIPVTGVKVTQPGSAFLQHLSGGTPTSIRIAAGKTVGDKRIFAYRTNIPKGVRFDKQIIIAASRNMHEVLAVWRMDSGIEAVIFLLFASLSIAITRAMLQRGIELKRMEEARAHLAAIVEFSDDAIISKDLNGVILSWNAGAERLFAYPPNEAIGRSITMLIPPELLDEEKRILQSLKAEQLIEHLETVRVTKDGRRLDVSVTSSPVKDNTGVVIGASKIIRDITERKLAEQKLQVQSEEIQSQNEELQMQREELQAQNEELQAQNEELQTQGEEIKQLWERSRQSEDLLCTVMDSISDPLFLKDRSCRLLLANAATLAVLDKRSEDVIGKTDEEIYDDPAIGRLMMANDRRVMESGQPEMIEEIVHGPCGNRTFLSFKTPYRDEAGRVIGIIGIARDITDRKRTEEALNQLNEELEHKVTERTKQLETSLQTLEYETAVRIQAIEALREKEQMLIQQSRQAAMGEMIGNIAHQWRQPLNTLGLYTQKLGIFYGTPNFNKELLDNSIAKSMEIIKHMSKTIDDFRDYFKPEKEKADFYVIEAIESTLSLLEGNFNNPKIAVDIVKYDNPVINGYQNEFAQVFLNILNNARDAIIEREIADAKVTITIFSENSCAVVTVADNAGGIPAEIITKVFEPYFTTKGPQAGTGIGMFMSKTIIEKNMGGKITARNTDTGAEFRIEVEYGTQN